MPDKKSLSERDICSKYIAPAIERAGWDMMDQVREEFGFTKGRVIVRGKTVVRGEFKKADYLLSIKPNIPLAVIEAKDNKHTIGDGMQQGLGYPDTRDVPFVFSSNGDGFLMHDRTGQPNLDDSVQRQDKKMPPRARTQRGRTTTIAGSSRRQYTPQGESLGRTSR